MRLRGVKEKKFFHIGKKKGIILFLFSVPSYMCLFFSFYTAFFLFLLVLPFRRNDNSIVMEKYPGPHGKIWESMGKKFFRVLKYGTIDTIVFSQKKTII